MKLPFIQLFISDYMRDTRVLSLAAKGGWMDIICMLHGASTRGTMTLPMVGWARVMGATVDQAKDVIDELELLTVADVARDGNANVTLTCRRMADEVITREQTRLRVERHRRKEKEAEAKPVPKPRCNAAPSVTCNADETDRSQKSEGIIQKSEPILAEAAAVGASGKSPKKPRERNQLFDELARVCGHDPMQVTRSAGAVIGTALRDIKAVFPDVTADEIARRAEAYRKLHPEWELTPSSLAKYWAQCVPGAAPYEGAQGKNVRKPAWA